MNYDLINVINIKIRTKKLFRPLFKKIPYAAGKWSNLHSLTIFLPYSLNNSLTLTFDTTLLNPFFDIC